MRTLALALLVILGVLPACGGLPRKDAHEILDERSGNTLFVVARPIVFARERTDVAAHARDYATLAAVEVDVSGNYRELLLLYRWSTVDRRMSPPPAPDQGEIKILADGRSIELTPLETIPVDLARRSDLHRPNHSDVLAHAYEVDPQTLRFIAASRELRLRMPQERLDLPFALWEDGREALAQLLQSAHSRGR